MYNFSPPDVQMTDAARPEQRSQEQHRAASKGGEQASKVEGTMPASKREKKDAKGACTDTRIEWMPEKNAPSHGQPPLIY